MMLHTLHIGLDGQILEASDTSDAAEVSWPTDTLIVYNPGPLVVHLKSGDEDVEVDVSGAPLLPGTLTAVRRTPGHTHVAFLASEEGVAAAGPQTVYLFPSV